MGWYWGNACENETVVNINLRTKFNSDIWSCCDSDGSWENLTSSISLSHLSSLEWVPNQLLFFDGLNGKTTFGHADLINPGANANVKLYQPDASGTFSHVASIGVPHIKAGEPLHPRAHF